jgi:serine/threonine protein phosphatase PrpC
MKNKTISLPNFAELDRDFNPLIDLKAFPLVKGPVAGEILADKKAIINYKGSLLEQVYAFTDIGIDYPKITNEDRILVLPSKSIYSVIDGMGGKKNGHIAAQVLAESIMAKPENVAQAVSDSAVNMPQSSGACFASIQLTKPVNTYFNIDIYQAGDVKTVIVDKNWQIIYQTDDQNLLQDVLKSGQIISNKEANNLRTIVTNGIIAGRKPTISQRHINYVPANGYILMYSDGIGDNLTPIELINHMKYHQIGDAIQEVLDVTGNRMGTTHEILEATPRSVREGFGLFSDNYSQFPKPDNRSLLVIDLSFQRSYKKP